MIPISQEVKSKDNLPKVTYLVVAEVGFNPGIFGSKVSVLNHNSVLFGLKTLGGRSRILFTLDQSLPECLAHSRPSIPVCLNRNLVRSLSEGITHQGGRRWCMGKVQHCFTAFWLFKSSLLTEVL